MTTPMKTANAASKTESNRDNRNLETDNPINHAGNAQKWKWIRFKFLDAASWFSTGLRVKLQF
jgi:hypothetical protein